MTFNNLKIGELFQFMFDLNDKYPNWRGWAYKKISADQIECIHAPKTEQRCLGQKTILNGNTKFAKVKIIPGC